MQTDKFHASLILLVLNDVFDTEPRRVRVKFIIMFCIHLTVFRSTAVLSTSILDSVTRLDYIIKIPIKYIT